MLLSATVSKPGCVFNAARNRVECPGDVERWESEAKAARMITAEQGRALWAELHRRGVTHEGREDGEWLAAFARRLPCGECRAHWEAMVARTPQEPARYFGWTVDRHNEVNAKLGKGVVSAAAARSLWHEPGDPVATSQQGA